ncbi:ABC transporter ATP-binding protein [Nitratidesulfovibrio vulgaris]|uniref:ABC transporter ATP-binding protein n=1 Tax=Nitratidesulfovibrio vulgaris TaxID=881 RepID=UPI0013DF8C77|nr:ABC transporter ATP-binding protein [Nitratidesulfovibrio vulgaris]
MFYDTNENGQVAAIMRDDPTVAIAAERLGKCYEIFDRPADRLKQMLLRRSLGRPFWALQDVSFTVRKGEALGVVGHNGAGKSTLLQILAGALKPTTGEALLRGRVASLLELGSGFLPDFTGRENVFVNGTALGLSTREVEQRLDEIRDFAEIGEFFDQPVKTYSSGMFVRLAFAVQACLSPDILIVDEALAVGDIFFQQKCHAHMAGLLDKGVAILLVTHDVQAVRKYCSSVILLENGRVTHQGEVETGLRLYGNSRPTLAKGLEASPAVSDETRTASASHSASVDEAGDMDFWPPDEAFIPLDAAQSIVAEEESVRIDRVALCTPAGSPCRMFEQGQYAHFFIEVTTLRDVEQLAIGLTINTKDNLPLYCTNSLLTRSGIPATLGRDVRLRLCWKMRLPVACGDYTFSVGIGEHPSWIAEQLEYISAETLIASGKPLFSLLKAGSFVVCKPSHGLQIPFIGLVDIETDISFRTSQSQ